MKDSLDYWIFIGIGDDIVKFPQQRSEYQHLVKLAKSRNISENKIPRWVLWYLKKQDLKPLVLSYSFYSLFFKQV